MTTPERAVFLFDGPNFYKNLKKANLSKGHLDFWAFARNLSGPRTLLDVMFFTSPTDSAHDAENYAKLQKFFAAVQQSGVILRLGKLVHRKNKCPICKKDFSFKTEKSVDVQIAIEIVLGAAEDRWDVLYLASCDSDLIPAIEYVRSKGKKVFLMLPDGAPCYSVGNACDSTIRITQGTLDAAQASFN